MKSPKLIEKFVKDSFELFRFNYDFVFKLNPISSIQVKWATEDGTINMNAVSLASRILGVSVDTILNADYNVIFERVNKYPYVRYSQSYYSKYNGKRYYKDNVSAEEVFFTRLFDYDDDGGKRGLEKRIKRYDPDNIRERLIQTIMKQNEVSRGLYHKNAEVINLDIITDNFFSYEKGELFCRSFIDMYDRLIDLFFKALESELSEEEINEYNFLVSVLGFVSIYNDRANLYYDNIQSIKRIPNISRDNLFDYFWFNEVDRFEPWKCVDFINNKELVQQYLDRFPQCKARMREFAVDVTKIRCYFNWSDGKKFTDTDDIDKYIQELEEEKPLSKEEYEFLVNQSHGCERVKVYVSKIESEQSDDASARKSILSYCRPAHLGGLKIRFLNRSEGSDFEPQELKMLLKHSMNEINYYDFFEDEIDIGALFFEDVLFDTASDSDEDGGISDE